MKKLDWYILQKFIITFFFCILLFTVIAVVIDVSEKADDLVKTKLGFMGILTQYYFGFIPGIVALLFPLFVFIAVIFFTSKMAGQSEVIAILASGVSFNRWLRPYLIGGIFLGGLLLLADSYVVPKANRITAAFSSRYFDANSSYEKLNNSKNAYLNTIYMRIDSFSYAGITNYDTARKSGSAFFMNKLNGTQVVKNIRASSIMWDTATKKWKLDYAVERNINGMIENVTMQQTRLMDFSFRPNDLKTDKYTKDKLSSVELQRFIKLEEMRGSENLNELKVEINRRFASPITVFLLTLIAAVVAGRKVRGGSGVHLALGFLVAVLFILADRFSTVFSTKGNLPPAIAAWIPNVVFLIVFWRLYKNAPK
jgi:lipopolysaccharide export system permease protein